MSAGAAPKQGDHVFNAIETALLKPFETIQALRSELVEGTYFIHDYLLTSYSVAKNIAGAPTLVQARSLIATAGAEDAALREISALMSRFPGLARLVTPAVLRQIHTENADNFGAAALRFEIELLKTVNHALEAVVAPVAARAPLQTQNSGIAYQQMLGSAFDPAAALVVIINSVAQEPAPHQSTFHRLVYDIAETLDRPATWKEPYAAFRGDRPSKTAGLITQIADVLLRIDQFRSQSAAFGLSIQSEITHKGQSDEARTKYGAMLHLLHMRLQQMRN